MTDTDARPIPRWAAGLLARLSRERPLVVTRQDLAAELRRRGDGEKWVKRVHKLQQLGWLETLHVQGAWAFVPPGEHGSTGSHLDLRAWRARDPDAVFALAGEAAAWHLGYLPRRFDGPPAVWIPPSGKVPPGLRPHVSLVRIHWQIEEPRQLSPSPKLLRKKGLDLTAWSGGLPAFGPEALLVQLSTRPSSFRVWADLIAMLDVFIADCDLERLAELLRDQSASAWQRAGYLLSRGGRHTEGLSLLERRPEHRMPTVVLGHGLDGPPAWSNEFKLNDRLVAPLQQKLGKA